MSSFEQNYLSEIAISETNLGNDWYSIELFKFGII